MLPSAAHQNVCDLCSTDCHLRTALILHKLSYHKVHQKHLKISAIAAGEFEVEDRVYSSDSDCEYRVITRIERIPKGKQEAVVDDSILPNDRSEEYTAEVVVDTTPNVNVLGDRGDSSLRRFECFVCKKSYKTKAPLIRHISSLHVSSVPTQQKRPPEEQKSYQCKHCDQTFHKRLEYDNHLTSLRDGKPFFCKVCRTGFDAKMELTLHKRNNKICSNPQKPRPYLCTYCGKYFERKDSLTVHTRIHTNDKPFACGTCGKSFIMKSTLQEHMNSHLGVSWWLTSDIVFELVYWLPFLLSDKTVRMPGDRLWQTIWIRQRSTTAYGQHARATHNQVSLLRSDVCQKSPYGVS